MATAAALALLLAAAPALAAVPAQGGEPRVLRYDLRPGDHLVYRQSLERRLRSSRLDSQSSSEWQSHLLVIDAGAGFVNVGIQRNRARADLERYQENGSDRLAEGRRELAETLARRGPSFAEANWLRPDGMALLPWSAVREATSERLPLVHEVEPLPVQALAAGATFTAGVLPLPLRAGATETIAGEPCLRLEGESDGYKLRRWHCTGSGTLGRLEYEARYAAPGVEIDERLRIERVSLARGEPPARWLSDPATALGALTALSASEQLSVPAAAVYGALDKAGADVQRRALAVAWRHRLAPPPLETLQPLLVSPSARVRTLAVRLLAQRHEAEVPALLARAAADPDLYVREAAAARPAPSDALLRLSRAVSSDQPLPAWDGPLEPGLGRALLRARRVGGQVAGSTLRFMTSERFRGWPYVLHVPDDYRGDEPVPLIVVLGGGPGRAIPTAQGAFAEIDQRGTLAVFPQANGMWWEDEPGAAFEALVRELQRELDVDTDRVTITGFSNGGTGTVLFASRHPDRYASYASLMGAGLPFFEEQSPIDPAALARLPGLFVHGERDETIASSMSVSTVKSLRRANPAATLELHLLPRRPHDVRIGNDEGLTLPFLERFTREPCPRQVALRADKLERARAFWVEVLDKGGGTAEVEASVDGHSIALRTHGVRRLRLRLRPELVDLSQPVRVSVNGRAAFDGVVREDPALFLRSWREAGDPQLAAPAELVLDVK